MERYLWVIPAGGAVLAGGFVAAGSLRLLTAQKAFELRTARLRKNELLAIDPARVQACVDRIALDLGQLDGLVVRAKAALGSIAAGLRALRLPEAIMALRIAGAAVRALLGPR